MKTKQMFHLWKTASKMNSQHHAYEFTRMFRLNHKKANKHKHEP